MKAQSQTRLKKKGGKPLSKLNNELHSVSLPLPTARRYAPLRKMARHWQLYFVILLPIAYLIIFKYVPMAGIMIAFKDYNVIKGIFGSQWVGLKYFNQFFESPNFWLYMKNTLGISLYGLLVGFPAPIILALALNEVRNGLFKKSVQLVSYAPYFISTVIMVSILIVNLTHNVGIVSKLFQMLGVENTNFM